MELLEVARADSTSADLTVIDTVLERAPALESELRRLRDVRVDGQRIRVHGDLHLSHVLDVGDDVVLIDFEGDPARPLSERRLKRPALTDLASLVCSFHLAARRPAGDPEMAPQERPDDARAAWAQAWARWMSAACIGGYRAATMGAAFLPRDETAWAVLFRSLLVAHACDELASRLGVGGASPGGGSAGGSGAGGALPGGLLAGLDDLLAAGLAR
jgi:maltose alpha-D-glucosyltransferase/alpha-amylase